MIGRISDFQHVANKEEQVCGLTLTVSFLELTHPPLYIAFCFLYIYSHYHIFFNISQITYGESTFFSLIAAMADGVSLGAGLVSAVIDSYAAVWKAYNTYLDVKDFPSAYQDIRIGLLIEQYKLELWANHVLSEEKQKEVKIFRGYWPLWKIFESIFNLMLESFQMSDQTMEACAEDTGLPKHGDLTGN